MTYVQTRDPIANPISLDTLRRYVPSLFAEEPHHSRSDRYQYIPTFAVVEAMMRQGWLVTQATQARTRIADKRDFTKHMLRFRHRDAKMEKRLGAVHAEVTLVNSHDGSSAYNIDAALFRLACLNGMIVKDKDLDGVKVHHKGNVRDAVVEGSFQVLETSHKALSRAGDWAQLAMSSEARGALAEAAHVLRFGDAEGHVDTPIQPRQLLLPRRVDDRRDDLWTVFNVVQENTMKGGLSAVGRDERGRRLRRVTTKEIAGIDQNVRLNKALWVLGERMASLIS